MFDIKKVKDEAAAEIAKEQADAAKSKIKQKLRQIAQSRAITANLEREYEALLAEIGSEAV
jgi:hypothetical protein